MGQRVFWVELNQFDTKLDKSTWVEIGEVLHREGLEVTLLTGFTHKPYHAPEAGMVVESFKAPLAFGVFRYWLLTIILFKLWSRIHPDDTLIVRPHALWGAVFFKWFKGCRLHLDVRTLPVEVSSPKSRLDRFLFWTLSWRLFSRFATSNSFITERLREAIEIEFGFSFKHYAIWTSGVNFDFFTPDPSAGQPPEDGIYEILYHGSLSLTRGVDALLISLLHLKPTLQKKVRLRIVGAGPDLPRLQRLSQEKKLEHLVHFSGFVPYTEIPKTIRGAHIFACPLPDRKEWNVSSPIKVFEYLACARPMLLTKIPAHLDIAQTLNSVVWSEGWQPEQIAQAIENSITHYPTLAQEALKSRQWARERFSWEGQGQTFATHIKSRK